MGMPAAVAQVADPPAVDLPLSRLFNLPVGPHGLELSDELRNADGRLVRLVGYMVAREQVTPGRFQIVSRPLRMSEHADGEADDLPPATVTVLLDRGVIDNTDVFFKLAQAAVRGVTAAADASGARKPRKR
jgi:hypothetical protein